MKAMKRTRSKPPTWSHEEVRAEPPLADPISVDAAEEVVVAATATTATSAASAAVTVSLNDAGVRLDEEEVRAVVEIAVSAAMPAIVEEVSRCVLLALESRYAEKVSVDEDRAFGSTGCHTA